ncbi:MAG: hypothetical protein J5625_04155 [Lachnospiraceae bacterium]|nr:hypothetical protein [Lachnospiraceae bacterium]
MIQKMRDPVFLNEKLCEDFRDVINSSPIFAEDEKYKHFYNLICATMDRLDTCVRYLNSHGIYPSTEEDFICFVMFACMIVDGVKILLENVTKQSSFFIEEKKYFKKYCMDKPMNCREDECPTDDKFFEYFRALTFAHPFETSRNKVFREKFGKQVSPWVALSNSLTRIYYHFPEPIGVKIYTEKVDEYGSDTQYIMFSFVDLKNYIVSRYEEIVRVTEWAKKAIEERNNLWRETKINREAGPIEILKEIKHIYEDRFQDIYTIQDIIDYMECPLSEDKNIDAVNKFRRYIVSKIKELCDAVDDLNYEKQSDIEISMISFDLKNMHRMYYYQLEKIFGYLREKSAKIEPGSNEEWGIIQTNEFYKAFAHKWVIINTTSMDYKEIHLLVKTACYLEYREQNEITG